MDQEKGFRRRTMVVIASLVKKISGIPLTLRVLFSILHLTKDLVSASGASVLMIQTEGKYVELEKKMKPESED
jgi:hypothetical protein